MFNVPVEYANRRSRAAISGHGPLVIFGTFPNILQTGISTYRARIFSHQFQTIVVRWVMAGGDHNAAVCPKFSRCEVDHFRSAQAYIENLSAGIRNAFADGVGQLLARQTNVSSNNDSLSIQKLCRRIANSVGNIRVELIWDLAADVVGLEAVDGDGHVRYSYLRGRSCLRDERCRPPQGSHRTELR